MAIIYRQGTAVQNPYMVPGQAKPMQAKQAGVIQNMAKQATPITQNKPAPMQQAPSLRDNAASRYTAPVAPQMAPRGQIAPQNSVRNNPMAPQIRGRVPQR